MPKKYQIEDRAVVYAAQQFINENRIFEFLDTIDAYIKSVPVWGIWLCYNFHLNENRIERYCLNKEVQFGNISNGFRRDNNYFPLLNIFIIKVADNSIPDEDEIYSFTRDFSQNKNRQEAEKFFNKYKLTETIRGGTEMFLTEYELSHFNKGIQEGIKKSIKKFYQNGLSPEFISESLEIPLEEVLITLEINNK